MSPSGNNSIFLLRGKKVQYTFSFQYLDFHCLDELDNISCVKNANQINEHLLSIHPTAMTLNLYLRNDFAESI